MTDMSENHNERRGAYTFPAWCQMETALDSYQQDRAEQLTQKAVSLGSEAEAKWKQMQSAADLLLKGVAELADVDPGAGLADLFTAGLRLRLDPDSAMDLLVEHVCVALAWEAMGLLDSARKRFWSLLGILQPLNPSKRARAFLVRSSRCFLFGFDSECVVTCRAVLDAEFQTEIPDYHVHDWWRTTPEGIRNKPTHFSLASRIAAAEHIGRLTHETRNDADWVRDKGNKAVHHKPTEADALQAVEYTVKVMDALAQRKR